MCCTLLCLINNFCISIIGIFLAKIKLNATTATSQCRSDKHLQQRQRDRLNMYHHTLPSDGYFHSRDSSKGSTGLFGVRVEDGGNGFVKEEEEGEEDAYNRWEVEQLRKGGCSGVGGRLGFNSNRERSSSKNGFNREGENADGDVKVLCPIMLL